MATILAIETSCDDTSAAVVCSGEVLSNVVSSQTIHNDYGGIVPELASREHLKGISWIVTAAVAKADVEIRDVDAIAVTTGPGLAGSLLVGLHFAKGLSLRYGKPLYPMNHIEAHIYSGFMEHPDLQFPAICLVVSGGHTSIVKVDSYSEYEVLGSTKDDAAGEAFDKTAKMLGLGYPGGPEIDALSQKGNPSAVNFPRGLGGAPGYDFSFSGLKTSVRTFIQRSNGAETIENIAASVQEAIVAVLVQKTLGAATEHSVKNICIAGGVSANRRLRDLMNTKCKERGIFLAIPSMQYCVDNAAMIGFLAEKRMAKSLPAWDLRATVEPKPIRSHRER